MDGAKAAGGATMGMINELEQAARKMAAGQAQGYSERVVEVRPITVRESLQQQLQYHCNEIRRILDLKEQTPHAILEMPANQLRTLHVTIS